MERPFRDALATDTLTGRDRLKAYQYLGKIRTTYGEYHLAHDTYTTALQITGDVAPSDKLWTYQLRAKNRMAYSQLATTPDDEAFHAVIEALDDYNTIFKLDPVATLGEDVTNTLYLERSQILYYLDEFELVLDDIQQRLTQAKRSDDDASRFGSLFKMLLFEQWRLGNTTGVSQLLKTYRDHLPEATTVPADVLQLLEAATTVRLQPTPTHTAMLNSILVETAHETFNAHMRPSQQKPFWRKMYMTLGEAQFHNEDYHAAEKSLQKAKQWAAESSEFSRIQIMLGRSYYAQKKYKDAYWALRYSPQPPGLDVLLEKQRLGTLGHLAITRKDYDEAIRKYTEAESLNVLDPTAAIAASYAKPLRRLQIRKKAIQLQRAYLLQATSKH